MLHIYETYCLDESVDKISFDAFIVEEIRNSKRTFRVEGRSLEPSRSSLVCPCQSLQVRTAA